MKVLSDQALGAIMMALQKSLLEQSDIVPVLKSFEFEENDTELIVKNPPTFIINNKDVNNKDVVDFSIESGENT